MTKPGKQTADVLSDLKKILEDGENKVSSMSAEEYAKWARQVSAAQYEKPHADGEVPVALVLFKKLLSYHPQTAKIALGKGKYTDEYPLSKEFVALELPSGGLNKNQSPDPSITF